MRSTARRLRLTTSNDWASASEVAVARAEEHVTEGESGTAEAWEQVVDHAVALADRRPGKRWRAKTSSLLVQLPTDALRARLGRFVETVPDDSSQAQRGLLVCTSLVEADEPLLAALGAAAERCFARVPNHGPRDQSSGTLCVKALAVHGAHGAAQLDAMLTRVHYRSIRDRIEAALDEIADDLGVSRADLAELSVPDHGFDREGTRRIEIDGGRSNLRSRAPARSSCAGSLLRAARRRALPRRCGERRPRRCVRWAPSSRRPGGCSVPSDAGSTSR